MICYSNEQAEEAVPKRSGLSESEVMIMSSYEIIVIILMIAMLIIEVIRISRDK